MFLWQPDSVDNGDAQEGESVDQELPPQQLPQWGGPSEKDLISSVMNGIRDNEVVN